MFVARGLYLIGDGSHRDYWNKVIKVFVLALALNRLHMVQLKGNVAFTRSSLTRVPLALTSSLQALESTATLH